MLIKECKKNHTDSLFNLYVKVSTNHKGIARSESEITKTYITNIISNSKKRGLQFIGFENEILIAEIHATTYGIDIFKHILTNLTIVVHPDYQGKGYGKMIFEYFLNFIEKNRPDILRVELESRSSNKKSIGLYESLGFKQEGIMLNKTRNINSDFEDSLLFAWFNKNFKK